MFSFFGVRLIFCIQYAQKVFSAAHLMHSSCIPYAQKVAYAGAARKRKKRAAVVSEKALARLDAKRALVCIRKTYQVCFLVCARYALRKVIQCKVCTRYALRKKLYSVKHVLGSYTVQHMFLLAFVCFLVSHCSTKSK